MHRKVLICGVTIVTGISPGGHSLLQLYTMCVLIKNNRPLTADCMYWIANRYKIYPPPIAEQGTPFCRHTKMFKDRTAISLYWILEMCTTRSGYRGWAGRTLEPRIHSFYIKNCQKSKYWGLLLERAWFGGPICSRADPIFKATPPKRPKLEHSWGNTDIQSDPPGDISFTMTKYGQQMADATYRAIPYMNNKLLLVTWCNQNSPI
jgi:hypothetical protein